MIRCSRCDNETWATQLVTEHGPVMLAGPRGSAPQPVSAQVCVACGHIELYGPQPVVDEAAVTESTAAAEPVLAPVPTTN
jgi:hypothetical protein